MHLNRLPGYYSSGQGVASESPAIFGGGGLALTQAADSIDSSGLTAAAADDFFYVAANLQPIQIGTQWEEAGACLEVEDNEGAAIAMHLAAHDMRDYGRMLLAEEDPLGAYQGGSAGGLLVMAADEVSAAASALRPSGGASSRLGQSGEAVSAAWYDAVGLYNRAISRFF